MRAGRLAAGILAALILSQAATVVACGIDGVPSLLVNGRLVAPNTALPVRGQLATWTPFAAPGAYPAGHELTFMEAHALVALTLPPGAFKRPWRWLFGDGAAARGFYARHTYRRPGTYVVTVQFYLGTGAYARWYQFDATALRVRR